MLGDRIRTLRTAKSISQVELAHRLGVSKQSVSNWENNNIMPSIDMLVKMAEYFHCTTDYLLELGELEFTINTSKLTEVQFHYIAALVKELERLNAAMSREDRQ